MPIRDWLGKYRKADLSVDLIAELIVSIMLVPQAMAYAMLAGLPPQVGLIPWASTIIEWPRSPKAMERCTPRM